MKRVNNKENSENSSKKLKSKLSLDTSNKREKRCLRNSINIPSSPQKLAQSEKSSKDNNVTDNPAKNGKILHKENILTTDVLVNKLKSALANPPFIGENFSTGKANELPSVPGLTIKDSHFTAPLSLAQVENLVELSNLVSPGHYKVTGSFIKFNNPEWSKNFPNLIDGIATKMGFQSNKCTIKLNSLDLFTTGSKLQVSKRENKKENITTLLLSLPSFFTGGNLVVNNHIGDETLEFVKNSYDLTFAAFHSNLSYEFQEIITGQRVVLSYELLHEGGGFELKKNISNVNELTQILKGLDLSNESTGIEKNNNLTILLDEEYSDEQIKSRGLGVLKNLDKNRFDLLCKANEALNLDKQYRFLIAHLVYEIETDLSQGHGFDILSPDYIEEYQEVDEEKKYKKLINKYGYVKNDKVTDDEEESSSSSSSSSDEESYGSDQDDSDLSLSDDNEYEMGDSESESDTESEDDEFWYNKPYDRAFKEYIFENAVTRYKKRTGRKAEKEVNRVKRLRELFNEDGSPIFIQYDVSIKILNKIIDPNIKSNSIEADLENLSTWNKTTTIVIECREQANVSKTKFYHKFALLLWPKLNEIDSSLNFDFRLAIDNLLKTKSGENLKENLEKVLTKMKTLKIGRAPRWWLYKKDLIRETRQLTQSYDVYTIKMLRLLKTVNNLELTKEFIENCMLFYNEEICNLLAEFIQIFGWKSLEKSLFKCAAKYDDQKNESNPNIEENMYHSCLLVQALFKLDQTSANQCFNDTLLGLLNKTEFKIEKSNLWYYKEKNGEKSLPTYYKIAETIGFISNRKKIMTKFVTICKKLEYKHLHSLVDQIVRNKEKFLWYNKTIGADLVEYLMRYQVKGSEEINKLGIRLNNDLVKFETRIADEAALNYIELLEILKDLRLIKFFISNIVSSLTEKVIVKLAAFLIEYGWKELQESFMSSLFSSVTEKNFASNCNLVRTLINLNQKSIANDILKASVLVVLENRGDFKKLADINIGLSQQINWLLKKEKPYKTFLNYFYLFEMIFLHVEFDDFKKASRKFIDFTKKFTSQNIIEGLLDEILKKSELFKKSCDTEKLKFISDLFDIRLEWLAKEIENKQKWTMTDAKLSGHPKVEDFLKSNKEHMLYSYGFTCKEDACRFISNYQGTKKTFSTRMHIEYEVTDYGSEKIAGVFINKTEDYFVNLHKKLQLKYDQLKRKFDSSFMGQRMDNV